MQRDVDAPSDEGRCCADNDPENEGTPQQVRQKPRSRGGNDRKGNVQGERFGSGEEHDHHGADDGNVFQEDTKEEEE